MILLRKVEGISWSFVRFAGSVELGIPTQLKVHSPTKGVSKSNGELATYICCMVSTIDFFNFFSISQSTTSSFLVLDF
jgi:hypothetical protein